MIYIRDVIFNKTLFYSPNKLDLRYILYKDVYNVVKILEPTVLSTTKTSALDKIDNKDFLLSPKPLNKII
jgi:hypothetical protein